MRRRFVDERQLVLLDQHAQGLSFLGPGNGAEARRHQRAQWLGLAPEGSEIGRGEAEPEGAAGFEVAKTRADAGPEQPAHHQPEWAGVEILEIDGVEMHGRLSRSRV
jgi:hypothetical protein